MTNDDPIDIQGLSKGPPLEMKSHWFDVYSVSVACQNQKKIVNHEGRWWLLDFRLKKARLLDPLLNLAGWNVSALSLELNIELRTFMRIVEKSLGKQAKSWLREQRVIAACHLIRAEGRIGVVSIQLGFRNESDFSREFRKLMGLGPSDFLKIEKAKMFTAD